MDYFSIFSNIGSLQTMIDPYAENPILHGNIFEKIFCLTNNLGVKVAFGMS